MVLAGRHLGMTSDPPGRFFARGVTAREQEVLSYIGRRFGNPEIADVLPLSIRTVESHVSSLYRKLGVDSRSDLVVVATRAGAARRSSDVRQHSRVLAPAGNPVEVLAARRILAVSWALKESRSRGTSDPRG